MNSSLELCGFVVKKEQPDGDDPIHCYWNSVLNSYKNRTRWRRLLVLIPIFFVSCAYLLNVFSPILAA